MLLSTALWGILAVICHISDQLEGSTQLAQFISIGVAKVTDNLKHKNIHLNYTESINRYLSVLKVYM